MTPFSFLKREWPDVCEAILSKARVINTVGNQAVHSHKPGSPYDALCAVRELFHTGYTRPLGFRLIFNVFWYSCFCIQSVSVSFGAV